MLKQVFLIISDPPQSSFHQYYSGSLDLYVPRSTAPTYDTLEEAEKFLKQAIKNIKDTEYRINYRWFHRIISEWVLVDEEPQDVSNETEK